MASLSPPIALDSPAKDYTIAAVIYHNQATLYNQQQSADKNNEAESYAKRALAIYKKLNGVDSPEYAGELAQLAVIVQKQGELERALSKVASQNIDKNHGRQYESLCSRSQVNNVLPGPSIPFFILMMSDQWVGADADNLIKEIQGKKVVRKSHTDSPEE